MTSKALTPQHVHAIGVAALANAVSLMGDAEVLLAAGRPRSAYALGVIAVEELAKSMRCRIELQRWTGPKTVVEINDLLRPSSGAHVDRYTDILGYLKILAPESWPVTWDRLATIAEEDMRARERALYVEVEPSGVPRTPSGLNEDDARMWVSGMLGIFRTLSSVWQSGLDADLAHAERARLSPKVSPAEDA